jgi:hypothetical protein
MCLQDPEKAYVELLDNELSPKKAIMKNPEWERMRYVNASAARSAGLLAVRILSDAFFHKCGYRLLSITPEEKEQWEKLKKERGTGTRSECVWRNIKRLRDEAKITLSDLKEFLQLKNVVKSEGTLSRDEAAHSLTVGMMAYNLQRAFRADPNEKAEAVLEKVFIWLCGRNWEDAINGEDTRLITREGVGAVRSSLWKTVDEKNSEFNEFFKYRTQRRLDVFFRR